MSSRFWSHVVSGLTPYVPGEQPRRARLIKLNTNENPYPPSPRVLEALRAELGEDAGTLRRYPDPDARLLKHAIAREYGIEAQQVFTGNGSDEVLAHVFQALLKHEAPLFFPDVTYSFYPAYCRLYGISFRTVPLAEDFTLRVEDYAPSAIGACGGIIFPNPNAPTGRLLALEALERLLAAQPDAVVVVDEAYIDFGGATAIPLVARHPNLLVVHTFSKSRSLAGLRVGYAVGQPALIEALDRVKNSFNSYPLDRLAIVAATAAIEDRAYFERTRRAVIATREKLEADLRQRGFTLPPSAANFVFARHPGYDAGELAAALREQGILVRHFKLPRIEQFLRISVGTEEECAALVDRMAHHGVSPSAF